MVLQAHSQGTAGTQRSRAFGAVVLVLGLLLGCSDSGATAEEPSATDPAMTALDAFILENPVTRTSPGWKTRLKKPPEVAFNPDSTYFWKMVTSQGEIKIRMLTDIAPRHASLWLRHAANAVLVRDLRHPFQKEFRRSPS